MRRRGRWCFFRVRRLCPTARPLCHRREKLHVLLPGKPPRGSTETATRANSGGSGDPRYGWKHSIRKEISACRRRRSLRAERFRVRRTLLGKDGHRLGCALHAAGRGAIADRRVLAIIRARQWQLCGSWQTCDHRRAKSTRSFHGRDDESGQRRRDRDQSARHHRSACLDRQLLRFCPVAGGLEPRRIDPGTALPGATLRPLAPPRLPPPSTPPPHAPPPNTPPSSASLLQLTTPPTPPHP